MAIFTTIKFKVISLLILFVGAAPYSIQAATVMQITGNIKAAACRVNFPTAGIEVNLGDGIWQYVLSPAGSGAPWVDLPLRLTECPLATRSVTMTVNGTPGSAGSDTFRNTGSATNIQIQVQNVSDSRILGNGANVTQAINRANNTAEFNLQARAYSIAGNVTPGTIAGSMQVSFTYQ